MSVLQLPKKINSYATWENGSESVVTSLEQDLFYLGERLTMQYIYIHIYINIYNRYVSKQCELRVRYAGCAPNADLVALLPYIANI